LWRFAELGLARAISCVRVNSVSCRVQGGRRCYVKTRRLGAGAVIAAGNVFLARSKSRIAMFVRTAEWLSWEAAALDALHPGVVVSSTGRTLVLETIEGSPVRGAIDGRALAAVGAELARAHRSVRIDGRPFSHGDPHLANFLFDGARARLIDVETVHNPGLTDRERHADDLLVVLLDAASTVGDDRRAQILDALVTAYDDTEVVAAIIPRLARPRGLERVLWATRTHFANDAALDAILAAVGRAVGGRMRRATPVPGNAVSDR
jgi:tRNA A-37 threonylcarbamoyl transferase component Bud32